MMAGMVIFIIVYLALMAVCLYLGWRRGWLKSLWSLGAVIVSFAGAYGLARAFVIVRGSELSNALKDGLLNLLNMKSSAILRDSASLACSAVVVSVLLGIAAFWILFVILWPVCSFLKRLLFARIMKEQYARYQSQKKLPGLGLAVSLVIFGIVSFVFLFPLGTLAQVTDSAANDCGYQLSSSVIHNPVSRLYGGAGRALFDRLTVTINTAAFKNSDEIECAAEVVMEVKKIAEEKDADENSVSQIASSLSSSYLLMDFAAEFVANASNSWKNGESYLYITPKIPEGRDGELVTGILEILSGWKRENLVKDIETCINVYKLLQSYSILESTDSAALMAALSQEGFMEQLFVELSRNEDCIDVIPVVMHYGLGLALDKMKIELNDEYIVAFDAGELTEEDWIKEARAFSSLLRELSILNSDDGNFDVKAFLSDLAEMKDSKLLSNVLINLLIQMIHNMM